jgi:ubiquitin
MQIFVRTLTGKHVPVEVESTDLVEDLQDKICDKEGYPQDSQRLIVDGKLLKNGNTLEDYSIREGSTVHMILKLRGQT